MANETTNKKLVNTIFCVSCLYVIMAKTTPFHFHTPSSILTAGPSGSGKTVFTTQLLTQNLDLFSSKPHTIHYCYGSWQKGFQDLQKQGVTFHQGVPTEANLNKWFPKGGILVMDDLMAESGSDKTVVDIFTRHSHHRNITVLYLCQDVFPPGKYAKTISRNAHYMVLFKKPRDKVGIRVVLQQAFPEKFREVLQIFGKATSRVYGYLLLDLHPRSYDKRRIYSRILKGEGYTRVYSIE